MYDDLKYVPLHQSAAFKCTRVLRGTCGQLAEKKFKGRKMIYVARCSSRMLRRLFCAILPTIKTLLTTQWA